MAKVDLIAVSVPINYQLNLFHFDAPTHPASPTHMAHALSCIFEATLTLSRLFVINKNNRMEHAISIIHFIFVYNCTIQQTS